MTNRLALTASVIMLIAISDAAIAHSPKKRTQWPAASAAQAAYYSSFDYAAPWPATGPNVRRYRGGPKIDY
ncbi:hypothetical protein [Bradyrhizobium cenepequi]